MGETVWDGDEPYIQIEHDLDLRLTPYRHNEADALAMTEISNAPGVGKWSLMRPYPYKPSDAQTWLDLCVPLQSAAVAQLRRGEKTDTCPFIVVRHEDRYVGDISLTLETWPYTDDGGDDKRWILGYAMHPSYWGKGIMPAAARAIMAWGTTHLGIESIWATIQTENVASTRIAQKLGFTGGQVRMREWPSHQGGGEREVCIWTWRKE